MAVASSPETPHSDVLTEREGSVDRRKFLTHVAVTAPTLTVVGRWVYGSSAAAQDVQIPGPTLSDYYDLGDALVSASAPTMGPAFVTLEVTEDGIARFAMPRMEVGQGVQTMVAMMIAEELEVGLDRVDVTLADARPELMFNQLTGGSYNARVFYQPVSRLAATAREAMKQAASEQLGVPVGDLGVADGAVVAPDGTQVPYGSLSQAAMALQNPLAPDPKPVSDQTMLGTPRPRVDARAIVTGQKEYTLDIDVPDAKPTVIVHSPQIRGTLRSLDNGDELRSMPGIIDVATFRADPISNIFDHPDPGPTLGDEHTVIAIMGETFGHCLAAEEAVQATWNPGTNAGMSDEDYWAQLRQNAIPVAAPPLGQSTIDGEFEFAHVAHAPMETMSAIADVRSDSATIWSGLKIPIPAQQEVAEVLGLPLDAVTVHVIASGGSFGRRLFHETAVEAALASQAFGRPAKVMWSRAQDTKHDRLRPATYHQIRATHLAGTLLSFEHRFSGGSTNFAHGLGDALTSVGAHNPVAQYGIFQSIFHLQMVAPYDLGAITQLANETEFYMNTGSWRSVYTGTSRTAEEIMIDEIAAEFDEDPVAFRMDRAKDDRLRRAIEWVANEGDWGRSMPAGAAQGFAANTEHRSHQAVLVEIDTRGEEPRVTKAVMAADCGIPMNPAGIEGQMLSQLNDGIATVLRASIHIDDGAVRESSFGDYLYGRQAHYPPEVVTHVFEGTEGVEPGGFGEIGVPTTAGAIANAYARATGTKPRRFPINH